MNSKLSTQDTKPLSSFSAATQLSLSNTFGSFEGNKPALGDFANTGTVFGSGAGFGSLGGGGGGFGSIASSAGVGSDFASLLSKSTAKSKNEDKGDDDESDGEGSGAEQSEREFDPEDYKPKIHLEQQEGVFPFATGPLRAV